MVGDFGVVLILSGGSPLEIDFTDISLRFDLVPIENDFVFLTFGSLMGGLVRLVL